MLFRFGTFTLDVTRGCLQDGERIIGIRPKVFNLLRLLLENAGRLLGKEEILDAVWSDSVVSDESLARCISELRATIGDRRQEFIKTVPRRGYLFASTVSREDDITGSRRGSAEPVASGAGGPTEQSEVRPTIAVLPFNNLSADPTREYFADGMVEDIITELSRFSDLCVIARNSSFQYKGKTVDVRQVGRELGVRYILEGSIRQEAHRMRITAQLVETHTGGHRWAERYDIGLLEVFAVQDEISRTIATVLTAHIKKAEVERVSLKPPAQWLAYDYYLKATAAFRTFQSAKRFADIEETRRLLEASLAIDPAYARSYALLAWTHCAAHSLPRSGQYLQPSALERAIEAARQAVLMDPGLPGAYDVYGLALSYAGEHDKAILTQEKAYALNPNFTSRCFGIVLRRAGEHARAVEALRRHMRLDPFYEPSTAGWLGLAYAGLRRYADALPHLEEYVARAPNDRHAHAWLAGTCAMMGQLERARVEAAAVLRIDPGYTIRTGLIGHFKLREDREHAVAGLRKAGLPE